MDDVNIISKLYTDRSRGGATDTTNLSLHLAEHHLKTLAPL